VAWKKMIENAVVEFLGPNVASYLGGFSIVISIISVLFVSGFSLNALENFWNKK
jgi:hypothetical protein